MAMPRNLQISFLSLPGELRNQIYREYFYDHTKSREFLSWINEDSRPFAAYAIHWPENNRFCIDEHIARLFGACARLFLVSKQIHYEAHSLFYNEVFSQICFCFWGVPRLSHVRKLAPRFAFANMKGILGLRMSGFPGNDENDSLPIVNVLDWLAAEFGYGDVESLDRERHRQINEDAESGFDDDGEYQLDVIREEDGMKCCMEFNIHDYPHQIILSGTLGKVKCLQSIEERLRGKSTLRWNDDDPGAEEYFALLEDLESHFIF